VLIRARVEATHTGEFLGISPTGWRIAWDYIAIAHLKAGRVVGQWIQSDLYGIYQQLTAGA
jgi:predicted ester cyclase